MRPVETIEAEIRECKQKMDHFSDLRSDAEKQRREMSKKVSVLQEEYIEALKARRTSK